MAARLHDDDAIVRRLAGESLWSLWFRADVEAASQELQRLMRLRDLKKALHGFEGLLKKAPEYAEAYNQRAIFHYHRGDYAKAIHDCEKTLRLNPHHFGAAGGMGQCFMKQRKFRAALRIFRRANRINPNMESVREAIQSLERMLGEEGRGGNRGARGEG